MTTKGKNNSIYYHKVESIDFHKPSYVILSQIRSIDKKRCTDCIGIISIKEMEEIKKSLQKRIS